jgi:hypothetical protein
MTSIMNRICLVLLIAILCSGCPKSEPEKPRPSHDAGFVDASPRINPDAGLVDSGPTDAGLGSIIPQGVIEKANITEWMIGLVDGNADPHRSDIEQGRFIYPAPGRDDQNVQWNSLNPSDDGALGDFRRGYGYAVARFEETESRQLIVQSDLGIRVYLNGKSQPGDPYGSGKIRLPFRTIIGENLLVIFASGRRGNPKARVWITENEVYFNPHDVTRADLRADDQTDAYYGLAVGFAAEEPIRNLVARVLESEYFEETTIVYPHIYSESVTQIGFQLKAKQAFAVAEAIIPITLRLESHDLKHQYAYSFELTTTSSNAKYRKSFRSSVDHSIQYYGVVPPKSFDTTRDYGLVLSLHGASVEAIGQARAYSQKNWAYVIAATNRRPFGFDWEEWGRLNGLLAFEDARATFKIDNTQTHVTGHSMGGHGTWHFGVHHSGLFATVNPSAGWNSFQTYGGAQAPSFPFSRARAHSTTNNYLSNLARRGVYILHGGADDNVPVSEGRNMYAAVQQITQDVIYHEEPGKGHWWNGDASEGADCVDWPPMFAFMKSHRIDPSELEFDFTSAGAHYGGNHSFVTLQSSLSPMSDLQVSSSVNGDTLSLTTTNVRSMTLDGEALAAKNISRISVNGMTMPVVNGPMDVGPADGKNKTVHGPFNQIFHRPFCYVYYPHERDVFERYVAEQVSYWSMIGNGHACALPVSALSPELASNYNLIHVGASPDVLAPFASPIAWDDDTINIANKSYSQSAFLMVFPVGDRLGAILATTKNDENLLFRFNPFSSRNGMPDYLIWAPGGIQAGGHFDSDWQFNVDYAYLR